MAQCPPAYAPAMTISVAIPGSFARKLVFKGSVVGLKTDNVLFKKGNKEFINGCKKEKNDAQRTMYNW